MGVAVRKWCVAILTILLLPAVGFAAVEQVSVAMADRTRAVLDSEHSIFLAVTPHTGDAWSRLALRTTGKASNWKTLADLNRMGENLHRDREVMVPLSLARPELQLKILKEIFPSDRVTPEGWVHLVLAREMEGESLWKIAEWFTGDGANYSAIRTANSLARLSTRRGDPILIPDRLLLPHLRAPGQRQTRIAEVEDDPVDSRPSQAPSVSLASSVQPAVANSGPVALEFGSADGRPYAIYPLKKGEALYSSVAIRFTGRVYAKDVNEVVDQLVKYNGISDVSRIPAGYKVRIPMELLLPEYRPRSDPRRLAEEESRRESSRAVRRIRAMDLSGVHIILDAGHGGRDVGTLHDGIHESDYVYDVACRLKALLEKNTKAKVSMTTRSVALGYKVPNQNVLERRKDHVVLTSPTYQLENPVVGVHLRWYLANSILRKAMRSSIEPEKVIFISIHADSLHPSLRGAMAYVPGQRLVQGTFSKTQGVYLARSEVRESPTVTHTEEDALRAEGLSTELADSIIDAFAGAKLQVHPFKPVRTNVVRDGKEWVPAIIRYNKVPTRILLEIGNLGNVEDRSLIQTRKYREQVAATISRGIVDFFSKGELDRRPDLTANAAGK